MSSRNSKDQISARFRRGHITLIAYRVSLQGHSGGEDASDGDITSMLISPQNKRHIWSTWLVGSSAGRRLPAAALVASRKLSPRCRPTRAVPKEKAREAKNAIIVDKKDTLPESVPPKRAVAKAAEKEEEAEARHLPISPGQCVAHRSLYTQVYLPSSGEMWDYHKTLGYHHRLLCNHNNP